MQQRRPRLGDILDDYCPRERRITNHAVVAMIEDAVKQTRCTTCDADHEYKQAKIPAPRRKKSAGALFADGPDAKPRVLAGAPAPGVDDEAAVPTDVDDPTELSLTDAVSDHDAEPPADADADGDADHDEAAGGSDEWPVHRPLIRATLPRPEGQVPERKAPEFTVRQPGSGRGDANGNRTGHRSRGGGHRPMRQGQGQGQGQPGPSSRFGGPRQGGGHQQGQRSGQPQRHGSGHGHGQGQGQGQGSNRGGHQPHNGQRAGGGRKRGR